MSIKNAIMQAKLEGILYEIMVKTNADNVTLLDNGVEKTLSTKLAEIITSVNGKAAEEHVHIQSDITGLEDALSARPTTDAMNTAISTAISGLIDGAPETYDTLKEIAEYIDAHQEVVDSLNAAIGQKADKTTVEALQATVNALGALAQKDKVSESDLDTALAEKVNAAAEGNHTHSNKTVLDGISEAKVAAWDSAEQNAKTYAKEYADGLNVAMDTRVKDVEGKAHEHANATVLDGISAEKVAAWDKQNVYVQTSQPADMVDGDVWFQIIE